MQALLPPMTLHLLAIANASRDDWSVLSRLLSSLFEEKVCCCLSSLPAALAQASHFVFPLSSGLD